jgi:type VI protein secretion system component Hcp
MSLFQKSKSPTAMAVLSSLAAIALFGAGSSVAEDRPITAKTVKIMVTTNTYDGSSCSFDATSVKFNIEQTLNIGSQVTGSGPGKATFNPLSIVKPVDLCSGRLFSAVLSATAFSELLIVVSPPVSASQSTFVIRLGLVLVKDLTDAASDSTVIQEQVSFEYGDLTLAELSPSGSVLSCRGWDRARNIQDNSHCSAIQLK